MSRHTLAAPAAHAIEVKHSRFRAQAVAVASVDAAMRSLDALRDADAGHNCWAWRIGATYRSNDDGEPAGTAGRPILAAIDGQGFDHVLVVVARWFGGIKLGAGGLARAYGGAAAECLRLAAREPLHAFAALDVRCGFADVAAVHAAIAAFDAEKLSEAYLDDGVAFALRLHADRVDAFRGSVSDATRGRAAFDPTNL